MVFSFSLKLCFLQDLFIFKKNVFLLKGEKSRLSMKKETTPTLLLFATQYSLINTCKVNWLNKTAKTYQIEL